MYIKLSGKVGKSNTYNGFSSNISFFKTPQDSSCTATCPPSRKLYKLDEPETHDTA